MIGMEKLRQLLPQPFGALGLVAEQDGAFEQVLLNLLGKLAPQVDSRLSHHAHKSLAILSHRCDLVPCVAVLAARVYVTRIIPSGAVPGRADRIAALPWLSSRAPGRARETLSRPRGGMWTGAKI